MAVVRRGQLTSVFVVDGDRARVRLVSVSDEAHGSTEAASLIEVLSGLDAGERVVIQPPPALHDIARVRIMREDVAAARHGASS
jgi:hypothetical protein